MDGESNNSVGDWQSVVSNSFTRDIDNIPAPTQERYLDSNIITSDERYYHPNLFGKRDDKKYLKVIIFHPKLYNLIIVHRHFMFANKKYLMDYLILSTRKI